MPVTHFLFLLVSVIVAAGVTIALFAVANLPLMALAFAALSGTLILGLRRWG
ncbi:hypothetical protein [Neotabrizicola shimadae]|uniref:Uncharacterized protein n=1 Tax=Neotabrizicola shimadae TaxID=2807096 RepID=A0A8G0ZT79_9RHOB|nr:hypothetical protein [Neotabrizicola shimadae]QYZ68481.1 hypothetical protein JO391_11875 [Neotabrizicola shimadae]